jgi:hypothetical protein
MGVKMLEKYSPFFDYLLIESTINPEMYFQPIEKICQNLFEKYNDEDNIVKLCKKISSSLSKYKIKFIPNMTVDSGRDFYIPLGINSGNVMYDKYCTIVIHCNRYIMDSFTQRDIFNNFIKALYIVIKHELLHRKQYLNTESLKLIQKIGNGKKTDRTGAEYLSDDHEIMAFAWQAIEYFRLSSLSKLQILDILRKPKEYFTVSNSVFTAYWRGYDLGFLSEDVIKKFYKYAYLYANEE